MDNSVTIIDTGALDWVSVFTPELGASYDIKPFMEDAETGVLVARVKYPAGFINKRHNHPCAHGMLVLKGKLRTSEGNYGPGTFLWFPEGTEMWHGASEDEDVEMLFVTNKKFSINYL